MSTVATLRQARISPQKCRLVADQIRGLPVDKALDYLLFSPKKSARILRKVLESAIANAEHNDGSDVDELRVSIVEVSEGPRLKRMLPRAKGRANRILKRTCNITVQVREQR